MITIRTLLDEYGDMPLNEEVIRLFGIVEPVERDCMLRINDVELLLGNKAGSSTVRRLKVKYGLNYDESSIPASIFAKEYGMDKEHVINFIRQRTKNDPAGTGPKQNLDQ